MSSTTMWDTYLRCPTKTETKILEEVQTGAKELLNIKGAFLDKDNSRIGQRL